jgi:hypothetical protein
MSYDDFDVDRARELREKATSGITREARKSLLLTLFASLPIMAVICYAGGKLPLAETPELRMFYLLLLLVGLLMNTGMWAVCGMDARILLLWKEIKHLRLDQLSAQGTPPERASGGAETISVWAAAGLKPRLLFLVAIVAIVLGSTSALVSNLWAYKHKETFGGQEVAEVHVTPEGMFRVHSRISITRCADKVSAITLQLPHPGAVLESVSIDGREVPVAPVPEAGDAYTIMPGMPEEALRNSMIEAIWSPPAADVAIDGGQRRFNLRLQGLIPVKAYAANVVIEEGAPYRLTDDYQSSGNSANLYWTKRSRGGYAREPLGYCSIVVEQIAKDS